jgi:hypothetical protein
MCACAIDLDHRYTFSSIVFGREHCPAVLASPVYATGTFGTRAFTVVR